MNRKTKYAITLSLAAMLTFPVYADDDPNAAINAQTAQLNAETARVNAEAALVAAKAAKDKAAIESLGLPKFDNKTELGDKGGEIETAMLATRAVSAAASMIKDNIPACGSGKVVVLAGNQAFDLNTGRVALARMTYQERLFAATEPAGAKPAWSGAEAFISPAVIGSVISAVAGLIGNDVKVTGIDLAEVNDQMLATAVAGKLTACAILPAAQGGIADIEKSPVAVRLAGLLALRKKAADRLAAIPEKPKPAAKAQATKLKAAIDEYDAFYKDFSTPGTDGSTPFIKAILAESVAGQSGLKLLRIVVNKAGGSMTNSKNITTFFGADPIRVSGGLVASYMLVNAEDNTVVSSGALACQTTRVRLNDVQNGSWKTLDGQGKALTATAYCH